ncbi:MAG: hypothetical protein H6662_11070 [Ardenticatenaceae bacterium]|nr:hypothetical protein [Anaerolineales bacterium]MCB8922116.1 hypothetical protein [Ardenticatenaceae bacterium]MCB9003232.1 hypothetical protein [Ardenticatenaceae bacterium]
MAKADISITLHRDDGGTDYTTFSPGKMLRGTVMIMPDSDVNCEHLYVHLGWHTEGRGTRFTQKVETRDLFQGTLSAGRPMTREFDFVLPASPWSYDGHYISIVWTVTAQLDVRWAKDPQHSEVIVLRPSATPTSESTW